MAIYEMLKKIREHKSQEEIGRIMGVNRTTYSRKEHGQLPIKADEIEKLAEYKNMSVTELFHHYVQKLECPKTQKDEEAEQLREKLQTTETRIKDLEKLVSLMERIIGTDPLDGSIKRI